MFYLFITIGLVLLATLGAAFAAHTNLVSEGLVARQSNSSEEDLLIDHGEHCHQGTPTDVEITSVGHSILDVPTPQPDDTHRRESVHDSAHTSEHAEDALLDVHPEADDFDITDLLRDGHETPHASHDDAHDGTHAADGTEPPHASTIVPSDGQDGTVPPTQCRTGLGTSI